RGRRVLLGIEQRRVHRPVPLRREHALGGGREQVVQERPGLRGVLGVPQRRRGRLDEDRAVGDDVVERLALVLRRDGFVLVGGQHVALAARERLQGVTRALVLDDDV